MQIVKVRAGGRSLEQILSDVDGGKSQKKKPRKPVKKAPLIEQKVVVSSSGLVFSALVHIPVRTKIESNMRGGWQKSFFSRTKPQRGLAATMLAGLLSKHGVVVFRNGKRQPAFPVCITLTRVSPGEPDAGNVPGALKAIQDGIADAFGCSDNHKFLKWVYAQERSKAHGVIVQLEGGSKC